MGRLIRGALLILIMAASAWAQEGATATEGQIETLREQLRAVVDKESEMQERLRQLDEDLRPENIERSTALIGTTDAGALRDERRRQLERQKASVEEQLASLATSRSRLETAIAAAEARAAATATSGANAAATEKTVAPAAPIVQPTRPDAPRQRKRVRRGVRRRRS